MKISIHPLGWASALLLAGILLLLALVVFAFCGDWHGLFVQPGESEESEEASLAKEIAEDALIFDVDGKRIVRVGGYHFPPFVEASLLDKTLPGEHRGLSLGLIDLFNQAQTQYVFQFYPTTPRNRYMDQKIGRFQLLFFEDKKWGWQDIPLDSSQIFLEGGEAFVALRKTGRDQNYFDHLEGKKIRGLLGYHYAFAGFNSDPEFLKNKLGVEVSTDHDSNIKAVLEEQADLAMVTLSYLEGYFRRFPTRRSRLLICQKLDQVYRHQILVRRGMRPTVKEINQLLDVVQSDGRLADLFQSYGLQTPGN